MNKIDTSLILPDRLLAWLAPSTVPFSWLSKAVISTPKSKDGKVDYAAVPVGASIWVSVTDPSSPLHGRPILITKRPDNKFALTGGAGWGKYDPDSTDDSNKRIAAQRARKHLVLEGVGEGQRRETDSARADLSDKRKAIKQAQQAKKQAQEESAKKLLDATGYDLDSDESKQRISEIRETLISQAADAGLNQSQTKRLLTVALSEAKKLQKRLALQRAEAEALATLDASIKDADSVADDHQAIIDSMPTPDIALQTPIVTPELIDQLKDATPEEIEQAVKEAAQETEQAIIEQAEQPAVEPIEPEPEPAAPEQEQPIEPEPAAEETHEAPEPEIVSTPEPDEPEQPKQAEPEPAAPEQEQPIEPEPAPPDDTEQRAAAEEAQRLEEERKTNERKERAKTVLESFLGYQEAHQNQKLDERTVKVLRRQVGINSQTIEQLRQEVGDANDIDVAQLLQTYQAPQTKHAPDAFYSALKDHWNNRIDYASGIGGYATTGAAAAFAGMVGKHLDQAVDIEKMIAASSIEAASVALAVKLRETMPEDTINQLIDDLTKHGATNQQATENKALDLHKRLQAEQREIIKQRESGELRGGDDRALAYLESGNLDPRTLQRQSVSIRLEAENLMRQRENLGTALGSMQATAALVEALARTKSNAKIKDRVVSINVGRDIDAARQTVKSLGIRQARAAIARNDSGYTVRIPVKALSRMVGIKARERTFADEMERIKTDSSSTEGYHVPMWHDEFTDSKGSTHNYQWRTEQRNDIEWLRQAGGGLITRVTGAGKTNTALGYFGHQIHDNPSYTAMIAVPKGKASEWHHEAQTFSSLPTVHIPDDAKRAEVQRIIQENGRGKIFIMSHDQASRYADLLEKHDLDGVAIDEPHMLSGKGKSKRLNAGAQRIMKLGSARLKAGQSFNRVAMTATPAKDDPVNAFDLVNWVAPGKVGARTRFQRAYSGGFGGGTNAQDEAIFEQVMRDLGPYMSGERLTAPTFKTNRRNVLVQRSIEQREAQRQIEQNAHNYVAEKVADALQKAGANPLTVQMHGKQWRRKIAADATAKANDEIIAMHRANLGGGGGAANPKVRDAMQAIADSDPATKHVFYVDSKEQRAALVEGLRQQGFKANQIANMAAGTTSISGDQLTERRTAFKTDSNVRHVIIDATTAAGHNLQEGSHLHVLGRPADAATYLQAQGRIAREPRTGDVTIHTYRFDDSPFENADWGDLERQMKILRATAPGLTS